MSVVCLAISATPVPVAPAGCDGPTPPGVGIYDSCRRGDEEEPNMDTCGSNRKPLTHIRAKASRLLFGFFRLRSVMKKKKKERMERQHT